MLPREYHHLQITRMLSLDLHTGQLDILPIETTNRQECRNDTQFQQTVKNMNATIPVLRQTPDHIK